MIHEDSSFSIHILDIGMETEFETFLSKIDLRRLRKRCSRENLSYTELLVVEKNFPLSPLCSLKNPNMNFSPRILLLYGVVFVCV
jgi:hypothetical protein